MSEIHKGINKTEVAHRYYKKIGKELDRMQAKKSFHALRDIDDKIIWKAVEEIVAEQRAMLDLPPMAPEKKALGAIEPDTLVDAMDLAYQFINYMAENGVDFKSKESEILNKDKVLDKLNEAIKIIQDNVK